MQLLAYSVYDSVYCASCVFDLCPQGDVAPEDDAAAAADAAAETSQQPPLQPLQPPPSPQQPPRVPGSDPAVITPVAGAGAATGAGAGTAAGAAAGAGAGAAAAVKTATGASWNRASPSPAPTRTKPAACPRDPSKKCGTGCSSRCQGGQLCLKDDDCVSGLCRPYPRAARGLGKDELRCMCRDGQFLSIEHPSRRANGTNPCLSQVRMLRVYRRSESCRILWQNPAAGVLCELRAAVH